jgi:hypothetical protein
MFLYALLAPPEPNQQPTDWIQASFVAGFNTPIVYAREPTNLRPPTNLTRRQISRNSRGNPSSNQNHDDRSGALAIGTLSAGFTSIWKLDPLSVFTETFISPRRRRRLRRARGLEADEGRKARGGRIFFLEFSISVPERKGDFACWAL